MEQIKQGGIKMEDLKYIIFKLGEEKYSIFLQYIKGIEDDYRIVTVPNAPPCIKGIINLRGDVIPVYSLCARFNMPEKTGESLLIVNTDDGLLGFEVDAVIGIEMMEPQNIKRMPKLVKSADNDYMEEVLKIGKEIIISITVDELLSPEENEQIRQMTEEMSE